MFQQNELLKKIMKTFGCSFVNTSNELILDPKSNIWFSLNDIESEIELKCKVLEYVSRHASKTEPYRIHKLNDSYQRRNRENINYILGTNFTHDEMRLIYTRLGNCVNRKLSLNFINSGFDLKLLSKE